MKRSEYEALAVPFRAMLMAEGQKPQAEQRWPEISEWLSIPGTSTCTTPTCRVFGVSFPGTLHENADGVFRGICGQCNQPITPVPVFEED